MKRKNSVLSLVLFLLISSCLFAVSCSADDLQIGKDLFAAGDYDAAINVLSKVVDAQSNYATEAQCLIAECYVMQAKYADAIAALHLGVGMANGSEDAEFLKKMKGRLADCYHGLTYAGSDYFDDAISGYRELAQAYPDLVVSSQSALGHLFMRQGKHSEAIVEFNNGIAAAKLPDDAGEIKKMKGWVADCYNGLTYNDCRYYDQAVSAYSELAKDYPERAVCFQYAIGHLYARQGRHAESASALEYGISIATAPEYAQESKAMKKLLLGCYQGMKDYTKLKAAAQTFGAEYPEDRVYDVTLGICSQIAGEYEKALQTYEAVLAAGPESDARFYALIWKSTCLREQHKYEQQMAFLDQAILDYTLEKANLMFVKAEELYLFWGKHDESVQTFDELIEQFPGTSLTKEAQAVKGLALIDQGKPGEAREWYDSLCTSAPADGEWEYYLAYCDHCQGNYLSAQERLESIGSQNPGATWFPKAKYLLGDCCLKAGNRERAALIWTEVVKDFPGNQWADESSIRLRKLSSVESTGDLKS